MGSKTEIEWAEASWNPLGGCRRVSPGCSNCYAETIANRFSREGLPYHGLAKDGRWTGASRINRERLADPLRWKRPRAMFNRDEIVLRIGKKRAGRLLDGLEHNAFPEVRS